MTAAALDAAWRAGLTPDPQISVEAWATAHRILPATSAEPGRWRTSRTPYLAGIMDCLSSTSPIERVVVMAAAQVGKTEIGLNFTGSVIHLTPGAMLYVMPTTEAARRTVRTRVDPMIEATPELRDRVVTPGPRKAGNSAFLKSYPGGSVAFVGANSGVGLRSTPARFIVLDEVDAFPHDAGGEGDPVQLAIARTATFRGRRKILMMSTPTVEGVSRIASAYAESDQRRLYWPCPHCTEYRPFVWSAIQWPEDDPHRAFLACASCGGVIEERQKPILLANCRWQATGGGDGRTAGFHISGLASPFVTWSELALDFLASKRTAERLQVWTNTALGEPFEDRDTAPLAPDTLAARGAECDVPWTDLLPDGAAVITAGVDTQDDRIEVEWVAWGRGEESWSLDYAIVHGDTSRPEVWAALDALLLRRFRHPRAVQDLPVSAVAVDSGGHRTDMVMRFSAERLNRRVWAIKGRGGAGVPPWPRRPPKPLRARLAPVHMVGVDTLKHGLLTRLRIDKPGAAACHWPADRDYFWFQGLVAERPVRRFTKGVARIEWVHDPGVRNEPLDCRVYATAALHGLYAAGLSLADAVARIESAELRTESPAPAAVPRQTVFRSNFMKL
ncbi:MAG TPA: phage terminase large subunit family protein [Xanthobacteraceae bacterium]|nr:phage terminase large subunit family protein [Xanthobacteraceae bacterium]